MKYGVHLRLVAPVNSRIRNVMERKNIHDRLEAEKFVKKMDKDRREFVSQYMKYHSEDNTSFDLTINVEKVNHEEIIQMLISLLKERQLLP